MRALIRTVSVLFLALIAAPAFAAATSPITVSDAWIRPPAVAGRPAALYFTITNSGAADSLLAAATTAAKRAELHQHIHENGVMSMKKVETVEIPANGNLSFAPMSYHVMLFNPGPTLIAGAKLPVTLTFKNAGTLRIEAEVKTVGGKSAAPTAPSPDMQHMKH